MAILPPSRSSRTFLQRIGAEPTVRGPLATIVPDALIVHRIPLAPPKPWPRLLLKAEGGPPPDRGRTDVWPHGPAGEQPQ
jgi:hypothetical protein